MREDLRMLQKLGRWGAIWQDMRREPGLQQAFRVLNHWKKQLKQPGSKRKESLASIKQLLLAIIEEYLYQNGSLRGVIPPALEVVAPKLAPFAQQTRFKAFWHYQEEAHGNKLGGLVMQLHCLQQHWYDLQSPSKREENLTQWQELYLELLERFFSVERFYCEPGDLPLNKELWLGYVIAEIQNPARFFQPQFLGSTQQAVLLGSRGDNAQ